VNTMGGPTQRAPDWWESPRFQIVSVAQTGSDKVASSRPTYQRATQTVSPPENSLLVCFPNLVRFHVWRLGSACKNVLQQTCSFSGNHVSQFWSALVQVALPAEI
jgi:hypothetical protein